MNKTAPAFAKINISLDIVSKMSDGFHNMKMVMQTVSLCDEVTISCFRGEGFKINAGLVYLPGDERNIAAKAARVFYEHTGISGYQTNITLKKNIPVCAGLGGGSADGACVLRILNELFETGLSREELEKLGYDIGSDVPFCISGGTKLAEGRGEVLTDLTSVPKCHIVICKPPFSCSTPELFKRIKCEKIKTRPDTEGLIGALAAGDLGGIARRMYNVFEDVLPRGTRDIADIKSILLDNGALGAVMTGSGPAVFGLFDIEENARSAFDNLKKNYKDCFFTETIQKVR